MSDPYTEPGGDLPDGDLPSGADVPSAEEATELSRAEEIEIQRDLALGLEQFEGGIEG